MKKERARSLRCPACGAAGLGVRPEREMHGEVWEGRLLCARCGGKYPIREGMADLLPHPSPEVARERQAFYAMRSHARAGGEAEKVTRETILSLPMLEGMTLPREELETWRKHGREAFAICSGVDWGGKEVLELGAGRCWLSAHLARVGARVTAVDILDDEFVGLGCGRFFVEEGVRFERVICDMHRLPFRDESFDAVVATATLHHSPSLAALLREVRRVLRPEGVLVAANEPLYLPWREEPEEERKGAHEGAYAPWTWLRLLRRGGFRVLELSACGEAAASLAFRAVPRERAAAARVPGLAAGLARYLRLLALAPARAAKRRAARALAGRPMRPPPGSRAGYLRARLVGTALEGEAVAASGANWGPGWYPPEGGERLFRWSGPRAVILLPPPRDAGGLVLELATFHPSPWTRPVEVEVRVGGRPAGTARIEDHGWEGYRYAAPPRGRRPVRVLLRVRRGYFRPSEMGLGEDRRLLGVACRSARWEKMDESTG